MTGGRIKRVQEYVGNEPFMLTYGDGVSQINIKDLLNFHKSHEKIGTMTGVHPPSRFGEFSTEKNKITRFNEKPQSSEGMINGGFFVFNRDFFNYLDEDENCVLEKEPLKNLAEDGELMLYQNSAFWQCVDTYRELEILNKLWKEDKPWKVWK